MTNFINILKAIGITAVVVFLILLMSTFGIVFILIAFAIVTTIIIYSIFSLTKEDLDAETDSNIDVKSENKDTDTAV